MAKALAARLHCLGILFTIHTPTSSTFKHSLVTKKIVKNLEPLDLIILKSLSKRMRQSVAPLLRVHDTAAHIDSSIHHSQFSFSEKTHTTAKLKWLLFHSLTFSLSLIKTPKKTSPPRFLFQSLNPKIPSTSTTFINSKPRLSNASSLSIELNPQKTASTLREICEGHVPEHILRRQ